MHPLASALLGLVAALPFIAAAWTTTPRRLPRPSFRSRSGRVLWSIVAALSAGALTLALSGRTSLGPAEQAVLLLFAAAAPGIALCDAVTRRLPFWMAYALTAALAGVLVWDFLVEGGWMYLVGALIGAAIALLALGPVALLTGGGLARGDVVIAVVGLCRAAGHDPGRLGRLVARPRLRARPARGAPALATARTVSPDAAGTVPLGRVGSRGAGGYSLSRPSLPDLAMVASVAGGRPF